MIGQILSIIAVLPTIASFQMKTRKQIIVVQAIGSALFLASYFFLESWTAVWLNVIYMVKYLVFYYREDYKWAKSKWWLYGFLVSVVLVYCFKVESWLDMLPIFGAVFATIATYMKRENMLRIFHLLASPCWLTYNLSVPSVGGVICECFNLVSIVVGLIRYKRDGVLTKNKT